jgi:TolA-binding protein
VRVYLKEAAAPGQYRAGSFRSKLADVDRLVIAALQKSAQQAIVARQRDKARQLLAQLEREWPDSDTSRWAQTRLAEIAMLIVKDYLAQGDGLMAPPDHRFAQAQPFYEKTLKEDPDNEHALLILVRVYKGLQKPDKALQLLAQLEKAHPEGEVIAEARYGKDMTLLWTHGDCERNLQAFQEVVKRWPQSQWAPTALYFSAEIIQVATH